MTKTILAASILALAAFAHPAFANSEQYQPGPTHQFTSEVATHDIGSAQYPAFDGQFGIIQTGQPALANASSATVEPANSAPRGAFLGTPARRARATRG